MKTKQFLWAIIAFILVIGFYFTFGAGSKASTDGAYRLGESVFPELGKLNKLTISDKQGTVALQRTEQGWKVSSREDFPADNQQVEILLNALKNMKADQVRQWEPSEFASFDLEQDTAVTVEFSDKDGKAYKVRAGKRSPDGKTRYFAIPESKSVFQARQPLPNLAGINSIWLRKFLPEYNRITSISYHRSGQLKWQCGRSNVNAEPFKFKFPDKLTRQGPKEVHDFLSAVFKVRYMDVEVADANFSSKMLADELKISDVVGNVYNLRLLVRDPSKNRIRCSLSIQTSGLEKSLKVSHFEDELMEWHFFIPAGFLKIFRIE